MKSSLNSIFRTIWSEALGAWVAVSEITKTKGKRSSSSLIRSIRPVGAGLDAASDIGGRLKPIVFAVACCFAFNAQANPIGGQVVNGQATFNNTGNTLTVTNTPGTIINWQGFSINSNEVTHFAQQSAASAVLNRVITNNPSAILGTLSSNGQVFLVNPAGIFFGSSATVDVAGLVATSLNLSDADFLAGRHRYTDIPGAQNVSNAGNITARQNGQIYLIAPNIENSGIINAPNGEILLVAGHSVELVNDLDPNLRVNITAPAGDATNIGQLVASAGRLGLFGTVVKNAGTVSADSATLQGGKIVFKSSQRTEITGTASAQGVGGGEIKVLSDMSTGTVQLSGTLDASAPQQGDGGFIDTSAAHVQVAESTRVTTLAAKGKHGTWLIDPPDFTIAVTGGDMTGAAVAAALAGGNVIIQSSAGTVNVAGLGDIYVNDAITKTDAAATTLTLQAINNININAGVSSTGVALDVMLNADSDGSGAGAVNLGTTTISLNGGTMSALTAVGSSGVVNLTAGTATINSAANFSTLNFSGGTMAGTGNTTVFNAMTWTGGTLTGHLITQGTTTIPSGTVTLGANAIWDNAGTVTITSSGWGYIGTNAILNNSGTFDLGGNFATNFNGTGAQLNNLVGGTLVLSGVYGTPITGAGGVFSNLGTLNKTSTSGQSITNFSNTGNVNINAGTLSFIGTTTNAVGGVITYNLGSSGSINTANFSNAGTLNFNGTLFTLLPGATYSNTGMVNFNTGTVELGGSFSIAEMGNITNYTRAGGVTVNQRAGIVWDLVTATLNVDTGAFGGALNGFGGTLMNGVLACSVAPCSINALSGSTLGSAVTTITVGSNLVMQGTTLIGLVETQGSTTVPSGNFTVAPNSIWSNTGAVSISSGGWGYINTNSILNNSGTFDIGGNFGINFNGTSGAQFNNLALGSVNFSGVYSNPITGTGGFFNNAGTVTQTTTSSQSINNLINTGTVNVSTGTLILTGAWSNALGTINVSGGTLGLGGNFTTAAIGAAVGSVTRTGGTVSLSGILDNTGNTLDIGSTGLFGTGGLGTLSGTITGGTITGTTLTSSSGTLNNVTIGSSMTESGTLTITNDLVLGNGVNFDTGASTLYFSGLAANIGLAAGATSATLTKAGGALYANTVANNGVVTIGSGVTVQGYGSLPVYYGGGGWVNNGTIISNTVGQTFTISSTNFTNAATGVVRATAGTTTISSATFTSNAGSLLDVNGGTLTVSPTAWNGASNLNLTAGILNMDTAFSAASLGTYTRTGGTFNIGASGNLDNTGSTLDLGGGLFGTGGLGTLSGTITGGTITGTTLTSSSGKLNNVIIGSSMTESGTLTITNDLVLGNGVNFDTGASTLYFSGLAANIGLAAGATSATLTKAGGALYANTVANNGVVTIGSGVTVQGYGSLPVYYGGGGWVNNGTIISNTVGQTFTISSTNFTNAATGVVRATAGTTTISSATFTSNAGSLLDVNGGTLTVSPTAWNGASNLNLTAGILNMDTAFSAASLGTYTRTGGTFNIGASGNLDNTGSTLDLGGGLFGTGGLGTLSGTITGGTITGTTLTSSSGKLNNVIIGSSMTESGTLTITNDLVLGNGVNFDTGASTLYFSGLAANIGLAAGATSATLTKAGGALYANTVANNGVVTIGSGVTVQGYGSLPVYYGGGGWVNNGTIISNTVGQTFTISSTNFTNAATGVVRATAGTTTISSATFTSNAGSLLDVNGGTLTVSPTAWNGASNLNLTAGILNMDTAFSAASLGTYTRTGGTFNIGASGNLDNTGSTLDLGGGLFGTGGLGTLSGTITGGTITGTTLTSSSGKLNNVIIGSSMTESGTLTITNDLVLGNGVNFDTGASTLYFSGLAANIGLAAGATSATLTKAGGALYANTVANNGVVTIGSGVTVQGYGSLPVYYGGGGWVNNGTIISNTAGQTLTIGTTNFTNNNVMSATAGTLSINSANFTNSLGSSITAGTGTNLNISGTTFNNNGTISFSGGTATINPTTTLANAGTITLGGTTHTIGSGATTNWTNTGNIAFNTGTLNLNGNYTIAGLTSNLDPALHFTRGAGTTFNFGGTLDLAATTLDMGSAGLFGTGGLGILSGTLLNGTITGTTLTSSSGTLNNVTIGSSMTESGTLTITNDLLLGNGVNFDTGASTLYFSGLAANIGLAAGATSATLTKAGGALYANTVANNGVVTIGSGVTVQGYGSLPVYYGGGGWVNNGTIIGNTAGQTLTIGTTNFTNNNVMSATAGTLNVSTTTFTTSATSDILIGNGATLTRVAGFTNAGTLRGDGTLNLGTSTLTNSGAINPGSGGAGSFGMLRITGNLDNTAGTLNMEIGGLVPSVQHDRVYVSGTFTQGGTLNVSNAAYTPGGTDSFNLFQAGTLAGTFTTANAGTYNLLSNTGTVYVSTNGAALPSTINAWWLDGSGTWGTLANWTNQAVPVATDDVVLDRTSGAYTITNNAVTATIASLLSSENLLFSGGSLTVNGSTTLNGNTEVTYGVLNMNGGAINNGILSGINQVTVSTLTNNGIIAPGSATIGDPTNTFTITGNLVMGAGGAINLDLDNTVAGNYDILNVSGTANLTGGTLNLSGLGALGNYPSINVTGGVTGTFATVNVGGLNAAPSYGPNAVSIAITLAGLSWDGGAGTNLWIDALNWSTDTLPTSADEVTIGAVAGGIIISSGAQSANSLVCDANLTISGGSLTLVVPSTINATLTIAGGTLNAPTSLVVNDYQQTAGALNAPAVFALTSLSGINVAGGTISSASSIVAMTAANNITVSVPFSANSFILGGGTWNQISATLPSFNVSNFSIAGGTFIRALGGNGSALTPYQLTDIFGVQGIGSAGMLGNSYVLANNINASGTVNWNAGAGFAPIGISATPFTGTFDGMLKTVNNLAITRPSLVQTGLFGITATGSSISNVGLVGGVVSGNYYVGGLVGYNGGNVSNSYTSAGVSGALYYVGGLVGWNNGTVNNSHATGIVAAGDQSVGGLVGYNFGSVSNSYGTGNTTGSFVVGGLVGNSVGTVTNSFATGNVQGVQYAIGGLVGQNGGGTISNSFATGASLSTASGQVGGLVGYNSGTINTSYATGSVTGLSQVGGLVGYNDNYGIPGIINNSYWDVQTTLQAQGADVGIAVSNGLTTAQMKSLSSFTGWNIANTGGAGAVWRIYEGQTAPLLSSFLTPLTVSASGSRAFNASADVSALVTYSQTPNANLLGTAVANTSSANAGTYAVTPSGLYSNQTGYDITFTSGIVNITPAGLTLLSLSANDASKMYGDAFTFTGTEFTPVGLIGSDTISSISLTSTGAVATANVGNYAIVPSNAVFGTGSASNYNITYANGTLTVTQRPVTITAQAASMVYGSADPTLFSVGGPYGLAAGDSIITAFSGRFDHAGGNNVGIHAITQGSFTSSNYSISSFTPNTLTITPATLTVYADDLNKILGTSDPLLTYRVGGLKYFDTAANTLSGGLVRDTGETIGSYGIEQGSLAVSNSNYQLSFAYVPGTFSILAPTVVQEITQATVGPVKAEETTKVEEDEEKKKTEQLAQDEVTTGEDTALLPKQLPVCQ